MTLHCPALLVSAPASGQGKTTVTAALARYYRNQGLRVRVFKTGPDFIDPMILSVASGQPVYQLDLWMVGEVDCRAMLSRAAAEADLILVEGVMGLFDGDPSSADLAAFFGLPVLGVINASAMAQTFGAIAHGLASYRSDIRMAGVLANRVGSAGHGAMLASSLPPGLDYYGHLCRDEQIELPERHLGLLQADEITDLDARLNRAAQALADSAQIPLPPVCQFDAPAAEAHTPSLAGVRIGIARDVAFGFIYQANLDLLQALGAELVFFSPLADDTLPPVDSLWLPGGYPELQLARLEANQAMKAAIRQHHQEGKPILAECGGMLYLTESLTDVAGQRGEMVGLLAGHAVMQPRLAALGSQRVVLPEGELRGHTFHHSVFDAGEQVFTRCQKAKGGGDGEAVYRVGRLMASYLHCYFPSNPAAVAAMLRRSTYN